MSSDPTLKTAFRASPRSLHPTYTGGPVAITRDGKYIITTLGDEQEELLVSEVEEGRGLARIKGDGTPLTAIALSYHTYPPTLITAHQSLSVRYYPLAIDDLALSPTSGPSSSTQIMKLSSNNQPATLKNGKPRLPFLSYNRQLTKNQTHQAPIISLSVSPPLPASSHSIDDEGNETENTLFATGSADGVVKVWDTKGGFVTHVFKGHGGGVSAVGWRFLEPLLMGEQDQFALGDSRGGENGYMNLNVRAQSGSSSSSSSPSAQGGKIMQLITGSVDARVRVFDLLDPSHRSGNGGKPLHILEGHVSVVRGISVNETFQHGDELEQEKGRWMVTGGRDRVVLLWDFGSRYSQLDDQGKHGISSRSKSSKSSKSGANSRQPPKTVQTTLTNETIESVGFVDPLALSGGSGEVDGKKRGLVAYTGGEKGGVRLWDVLRGKEIAKLDGPGGRGGAEEDEMEQENADEDEDEDDEARGIREVLYSRESRQIVSVHHDQNIIFTSLETKRITRQIIGFNDEIIDSVYLSPLATDRTDSHIALATNSSLIRVYDVATMDARLISGHSDIVLCLDVSADGRWLVSGSKDNTVRVWAKDATSGWRCIAIAEGHAESIGAVAMARKTSLHQGKFMFSASQDKTVKMWDLSVLSTDPAEYPREPIKLKSLTTMKIHEKDINGLDVSPNDGYLVSGSQDKSIKVFSIDFTESKRKSGSAATSNGGGFSGASGAIRLIGTCQGHRRGVWAVKFSPTDKVIASCGGDKVARIWSLDDFTCVKTLEGHTNSVLRVDFMTQGRQLVSTGSDGLVKIWNLRDEECVRTLDGHVDKVWTLAISQDQRTIMSGGADSVLNLWEDCTAEVAQEEVKKREDEIAIEQNYSSYLALNDYKRAIQLALAMAQPRRLLSLFEKVHNSRPRPTDDLSQEDKAADFASSTGLAAVDEVLRILSAKDLVRLLKYVRDWNSRVHTSVAAQRVLGAILRGRKGEELRECFEKARRSLGKASADEDDEPEDEEAAIALETQKKRKPTRAEEELVSLQDWLDGIVPYTERHLQRLDRALIDTFMLDYVLGEMDGGILDGIDEIDEGELDGKDGMEGLLDAMMDDLEPESGASVDGMEIE